MAKLGWLSEQHEVVKFSKNADYAKTFSGFVQDLASAVTDYQVCAMMLPHDLSNISDRCPYSRAFTRTQTTLS